MRSSYKSQGSIPESALKITGSSSVICLFYLLFDIITVLVASSLFSLILKASNLTYQVAESAPFGRWHISELSVQIISRGQPSSDLLYNYPIWRGWFFLHHSHSSGLHGLPRNLLSGVIFVCKTLA